MSWSIYADLRAYMDKGKYQEALECIHNTHANTADISDYIKHLEASCYLRLGQVERARDILQDVTHRGTSNFWIYYEFAKIQKGLGDFEGSIESIRRSHEIQGWPESRRNGYVYTDDYFSPNIPDWTRWFDTLITQKPISCLEIGSWQGGSSAWLLDRVVGPRGGSLTCIDTFEGSSEHQSWINDLPSSIEAIFDRNVKATGFGDRVIKVVNQSQKILKQLSGGTYDFIYIDGAHEAKFIIQDALLSWPLVRPGGFLLFDDLDFVFADQPEQNSRPAIEWFCTWFKDEIVAVEEGRQKLIQKTPK